MKATITLALALTCCAPTPKAVELPDQLPSVSYTSSYVLKQKHDITPELAVELTKRLTEQLPTPSVDFWTYEAYVDNVQGIILKRMMQSRTWEDLTMYRRLYVRCHATATTMRDHVEAVEQEMTLINRALIQGDD